jgi:archaellum component FlaF (FlaF/FlaG flagellin family)
MSSVAEIIPFQAAPASQTSMYTAPAGVTVRIDKMTISNPTGSSATITINLVPSGSGVSTINESTPAYAVLPGAVFNSPNEYGHYLNPGDSISVICSAASTLNIGCGGTLVTS